eukprot:80842-Rhodomonas_salina.1
MMQCTGVGRAKRALNQWKVTPLHRVRIRRWDVSGNHEQIPVRAGIAVYELQTPRETQWYYLGK